ncbi:4a-hydroxytetrahydrobiopterin dehydratase [Streptomyces sp. CJ_13]|uniref:4a-hydroxytetrahydrobiopterin dehydratase n=1 Tax=Streptomyces sp. CJ_13 TaxID=2724943 RepID=UPI001BDD25B7|nr:4a-hydroxytetrahydrobiopterin dehydratase [Streptomyces sp. CJ_13]MBT1184349.1 4a-hydroxytetrahydrobiopterin dehydratase [Streptomyces sp. CJ_13]
MGVPKPLTDDEITAALTKLPGWERTGDEITRTYPIRYHAAVAAIVTIADRSRRIQHHADLDLAHRIDAIVSAHQSIPLG